ncbi:MAG: peptidylprolyl isomerase [Burkholderiales bacterium]|nr:peptidylprolyl isomerase [Burkholderiales bacterium]
MSKEASDFFPATRNYAVKVAMFSNRSNRHILIQLAILFVLALPPIANASTVRLQTAIGAIDITLYDAAAPRTVANFLTYVNSGAYRNSFVHRSVPSFVIQGGGFAWDETTNMVVFVPTLAPVVNEFSVARSNKRGTIANNTILKANLATVSAAIAVQNNYQGLW